MSLTTHTSVEAFFQEVLSGALDRQGVAVSESTEFYLVGLLGEYARARLPDHALSLRLVETQADAGERVRALKEVGDTTLYVAGFFADSLQRKLVGVDYYMDLGQAAYHELARRLSTSSVAEVYAELSGKFPRFVVRWHAAGKEEINQRLAYSRIHRQMLRVTEGIVISPAHFPETFSKAEGAGARSTSSPADQARAARVASHRPASGNRGNHPD